MAANDFYFEFARQFRGTTESVTTKLKQYIPILERIEQGRRTPLSAVDYGCGRGEWLQILANRGWSVLGVDGDETMAGPAIQLGHTVEIADALTHIKRQDAASFLLVSAFHLAEHLPPESLVEFVCEARRVLQPGGLLIVETPNPENLLVGSSRFYTDPTHLRPLPPAYLKFLAEHWGFEDVSIFGLNADNEKRAEGSIAEAFRRCLNVPPDYALVAQCTVGKEDSPGISVRRVVDDHFRANNPFADGAYRSLEARIAEAEGPEVAAASQIDSEHRILQALTAQLDREVEARRALAARIDGESAARRTAIGGLKARVDKDEDARRVLADTLTARLDQNEDAVRAVAAVQQANLDHALEADRMLAARLGELADAHRRYEESITARLDKVGAIFDGIGARLHKAEARIKRLKGQAAVFLPITAPLYGVSRAISRAISRFSRRAQRRQIAVEGITGALLDSDSRAVSAARSVGPTEPDILASNPGPTSQAASASSGDSGPVASPDLQHGVPSAESDGSHAIPNVADGASVDDAVVGRADQLESQLHMGELSADIEMLSASAGARQPGTAKDNSPTSDTSNTTETGDAEVRAPDGALTLLRPIALGQFDDKSDPIRILILKVDHIGDLVLALPGIELLRKAWPSGRFTLVCAPGNAALAAKSGLFDEIIKFQFFPTYWEDFDDLQRVPYSSIRDVVTKAYDIAIDFRHDPDTRPLLDHVIAQYKVGFEARGEHFSPLDIALPNVQQEDTHVTTLHNMHRLMMLASVIVNTYKRPELSFMGRLVEAGSFSNLFGTDDYVVLAPGGGSSLKKWPKGDMGKLAQRIVEDLSLNIVLIGGERESAFRDAILERAPENCVLDMVGKAAVTDLAKIIASARAFVGNDTGATHLAGLLGVPAVCIFSGVPDSRVWQPLGTSVTTMKFSVTCSPCHLNKPTACPWGIACMVGIGVDDVLAQLRRALAADRLKQF